MKMYAWTFYSVGKDWKGNRELSVIAQAYASTFNDAKKMIKKSHKITYKTDGSMDYKREG